MQEAPATARFRPRAVLSKADAIEIFLCRPLKASRSQNGQKVTQLATQFNISPKAVRDIWSRRTWAPETQHLWTEGEAAMVRIKPQQAKTVKVPRKIHGCQAAVRPSSHVPSWDQSQHCRNLLICLTQDESQSTCREQWQWTEFPPSNSSVWRDDRSASDPPAICCTTAHRCYQGQAPASPPPTISPAREEQPGGRAEEAAAGWDGLGDLAAADPFHADWKFW